MATVRDEDRYERVTLTKFHARVEDVLDRSIRSPVVLTRHGHDRHVIASAEYFRQLECIAAGRIVAEMDLESVDASRLTASDRAAFHAARPTVDELANDQWDD